ncbi:MAG: 30S ribosomal protein S3 [Candidatus Aenigmatarchaeota archaeon]
MTLEREFIKKGINKNQLEDFFEREYPRAGYTGCDIKRTPMGVKITIYADKPGLIIGRGGGRIDEITEKLEEDFGFEDPQIDVDEIEKPELDAKIMAKEIKNAIENGASYKRVAGGVLRSIMNRGAAGAEIKISGKLSGARGRTERFQDGYMKSCGEPAKRLVDKAVMHAKTKPGTIGVKVKIMEEKPDEGLKDVEEETEEEEKEEETEEEFDLTEEKVNEIIDSSISGAKDKIREIEDELDLEDYKKILDYEMDDKKRKGMMKFLKKKVDEFSEEE